jgi:hypothetical protein
MTLYNLKTSTDGFRITKFDEDLNVESSYITSLNGCDCPAGHRGTCRHREMLSTLRAKANRPWMYDYDNKRWYIFTDSGVLEPQPSWRRI